MMNRTKSPMLIIAGLALCLSWGIMCQEVKAVSDSSARAQEILETMTWKEKIAQMFVVALPSKDARDIQKKYQFGGYIWFEKDFKNSTPKKVKVRVKSVQKAAKIKMLMAVDEEGGTVNRVSRSRVYKKKPFASPRAVYKKGGWKGIRKDTAEKAEFLRKLGINANFAPVADTPYRSSDFMYQRSFSTNASSVSKYIKTVIREMKKKDLVSTVKHFPGYGGNGDTHTRIIKDKRPRKTFVNRDLKPFFAGIHAGCDMIMVSHNVVNCFDKTAPASLSKTVHRYLRDQMEFPGVIITDDIAMAAAANSAGSASKAAVKAVWAGNDMICVTQYKESLNAVHKALKQGKIKKSQVNESVKRILIMKLERGIIY
ncbi:MAG: beta-hexosaminidase [Firmicutes bacterium]|nr:beta-hexosaminidase [Bacillota bacterium]